MSSSSRRAPDTACLSLAASFASHCERALPTFARYWVHVTLRPTFEAEGTEALETVATALACAPVRVRVDTQSLWLFEGTWSRVPLRLLRPDHLRALGRLLGHDPCPFHTTLARQSYAVSYTRFAYDPVVDGTLPRASVVAAFAAVVARMAGDAAPTARRLVADAVRATAAARFVPHHPTARSLVACAENVAQGTRQKKRNIYRATRASRQTASRDPPSLSQSPAT